jgi:hypothetical protein
MPFILRLNFGNRLENFDLYDLTLYDLKATLNITQTDIRRMLNGKLSAQFWSVSFNFKC